MRALASLSRQLFTASRTIPASPAIKVIANSSLLPYYVIHPQAPRQRRQHRQHLLPPTTDTVAASWRTPRRALTCAGGISGCTPYPRSIVLHAVVVRLTHGNLSARNCVRPFPCAAGSGEATTSGGPSAGAQFPAGVIMGAAEGNGTAAAVVEAAADAAGNGKAKTAASGDVVKATRKGRKRAASFDGPAAPEPVAVLDAAATGDLAAAAPGRPHRRAKQAAAAAIAATATSIDRLKRPGSSTARAATAAVAAAAAADPSKAAPPPPPPPRRAAATAAKAVVASQARNEIQATSAPGRREDGPSGTVEAVAEAVARGDEEEEADGKGRLQQPLKGARKGRGKGSAPAAVSAAAKDGDAEASPSHRKGRAKASGSNDPRVAVLSAEEAEALRNQPLLSLGDLVAGTLVRRPSASVKTPYVADVMLLPPPQQQQQGSLAANDGTCKGDSLAAADGAGDARCGGGGGSGGAAGEGEGGRMVLAHAPALDCAGMISPGCRLYLSAAVARREGAPPAATSHAIQLVEEPRPGGGVAVVGCHPQLAERLAAEMLRRRVLEEALGAGPCVGVDSQRTFGNTRVDFVLRMADGSWTLLEVKNVVCADFPAGDVPPGRPAVGVYTAPVSTEAGYQPTSLFPHGAAKPKIKVVSDRAIKHVWELTQMHLARRDEATGQRLRCAVLFIVNRSDCTAFRPCHEADPLFAQVVKAAEEAGVKLIAYDICWSGGKAHLGKQLPVVFGPGVSSQYDPGRLQEVLHFNATDPRKNWKAKAGKKAAKD